MMILLQQPSYLLIILSKFRRDIQENSLESLLKCRDPAGEKRKILRLYHVLVLCSTKNCNNFKAFKKLSSVNTKKERGKEECPNSQKNSLKQSQD